MTTDTPILAWHNDPELKAEVVARLKAHRDADEIVRGIYQHADPDTASGYQGCALGCTLPLLDTDTRFRLDNTRGPGWWRRIESEYGIPDDVAWLIDDTFEAQDDVEAAAAWAVAVIEAIPVGADLTGILCEWCEWHYAQMYDGEPSAQARWLIAHLAAAPVPQATP